MDTRVSAGFPTSVSLSALMRNRGIRVFWPFVRRSLLTREYTASMDSTALSTPRPVGRERISPSSPKINFVSELHKAIEKSRAMVLLWSKSASRSRWVAAEILTAFHMGRFIFPCIVDETFPPQFLGSAVHVDLRRATSEGLRRLVAGVREAPRQANPVPPLMAAATARLNEEIGVLADAQQKVTSALLRHNVDTAAELQKHDRSHDEAGRALRALGHNNVFEVNFGLKIRRGTGSEEPTSHGCRLGTNKQPFPSPRHHQSMCKPLWGSLSMRNPHPAPQS
jgi:hypothetical protein